jgi:hypothetical protein
MGITYMTVDSKNANRKEGLIKGLQEALGKQMFLAPHCTPLIDELQNCRWSDRGEGKMINSSSYHLLDSSQYAKDILPPPEKKLQSFTLDQWYANLLQANDRRKKLEEQAVAPKRHSKPIRIRRGSMWK